MTASDRRALSGGGEAAFDRLLAASARSFVVAPLPADVLEAPRPVSARSWLRFAAPLAATAIVVLALATTIRVPKVPGAGTTGTFRTASEISYALRSAGYACHSGAVPAPGEPRMDAIVCAALTGTLAATVVISEDSHGDVGEIHIAVVTPGSWTIASDQARADQIRTLIGTPFADPSAAAAARSWLADVLPLAAGGEARVVIDTTPIVLERARSDGYRMVLGDLGRDASPRPSG